MRKSIKKIVCAGIVFAVVSIFAGLGGFCFSSQNVVEAATTYANTFEIGDKGTLQNRIINYRDTSSTSNFVLTSDIDMSGITLNSTLGTEEFPFQGTFDGQGHTISNLTIDLSQTLQGTPVTASNKYAGLFGITNGATIKNVALSGTITIILGDCTTAYVGSLVANAQNTTIQYVQNSARMVIKQSPSDVTQTSFDNTLILGGLVGISNSSSISYVINRQTDIGSFSFNDNKGRISSIGGVVGQLLNSSLVFGVSRANLNVTVGESYAGTLNIGGVFGSVSGSKVFQRVGVAVADMIVENTLNVTNNSSIINATVNVGQVGGVISSPYPTTLGLSSIYYRTNSTHSAFGETNTYTFSNSATLDGIIHTDTQFTSEAVVNDSSKNWHSSFGLWDFDTVWYFNGSTIYLQSFYGGFNIQLASDLQNSTIFEVEGISDENGLTSTRYNYQSQVTISFRFRDGMEKYYTITGLSQGSVENKVTIDYNTETGQYTNTSDPENYAISEDGGVISVTIKSVNRSTAGTYDINYRANEFTIEVTTKLFDSENQLEEGVVPGDIYYAGGNTAQVLPVSVMMTYNTTRTLEVRLRNANSPYALQGWYLEVEDGQDKLLSSGSSLAISFGSGDFTDNCKIYARYQDDACRISFEIKGDGISEIYIGDNLVTEKVATVLKTASRLKLEIYVEEGYTFDVQRFLDMMATYRGEDTTTPFCTWENEASGDDRYYLFYLDMTTLRGEFSESFSVELDTEKTVAETNTWIWYVVGGVGGAVVLGVAIFLIVFFVKRRGGGGGNVGGYSRKSFRGYY